MMILDLKEDLKLCDMFHYQKRPSRSQPPPPPPSLITQLRNRRNT